MALVCETTSDRSPTRDPGVIFPAEIWRDILRRSINPYRGYWCHVIRAREIASMVSSSWRGTVKGSPELWCKLYLTDAFSTRYMRWCLENTGKTTDILDIDPRGDFLHNHFDLVQDMAGRVCEVMVRSVGDDDIIALLRALSDLHTPRLNTLQFFSNVPAVGLESLVCPAGIRLQCLTLQCFKPLWRQPEVYRTLTKLSLARFTGTLALEWVLLHFVLSECGELRDLEISQCSCTGWKAGTRAVVPSVECLTWRIEDQQDAEFMGRVELPALRAFSLQLEHGVTLSMVAAIVPKMLGDAASITLAVTGFQVDDLVSAVPLFANVAFLNVRQCGQFAIESLLQVVAVGGRNLAGVTLLKVKGALTSTEAESLLRGPFSGNLRIVSWESLKIGCPLRSGSGFWTAEK
ncbi:hypothetical protein C8F04DRAFT_1252218 [Mycena alexandri]|uniref:F-box domain-containing protein n=1 Tax=Mycena alexandri TaxID=1745969 RepID=A0AAD6T9H7_9AGAR|nr:hypothetical protein C8F04DRAFT_1252218 [Mycena alexandri]